MKIKSILVGAAFATASLFAISASAQVVGSFDSGNCYPFACNDSGTSSGPSIDYQQIYTSAAFINPTTITKLTFFNWTPFPTSVVLNGDYDITLSTTTDPIGAGYPISLSNTQTFFNGALGGPVGSTFSISGAAYNYDPSMGNLVMEIMVSNQDNVPNAGPPNNGYFWADYTGTATTRAYMLSDGVIQSGTGALVTQFNSVPEPATWAMMLVGFGGLGLAIRSRRGKAVAA